MKISVDKKEFSKALSRAASVADKKSTLPLLSCVLLDTGTNAVSVMATDLYLESETLVTASVDTKGSAAVSARDLLERVKAMPDGPVVIEATKDRVTLSAAGSRRKFVVHAMDPADFPRPSPLDGSGTESTAGELAALLCRTHYAVSTDETRAHVNSALFKWSDGTLTIASTDGHRLAVASAAFSGDAIQQFLLPLRALAEVRRLLSEQADDSTVTIARDDKRVRFACGDVSIGAKLVDAQFPPYEQVIPKTSKTSFTAPRLALADALAAVSTSNPSGGVGISFHAETLHVDAQGNGEGHDEIAIEFTDGKKPSKGLNIGFQSKYLRDALSCLSDDTVTIRVSGELDPLIIESEGFTGVVMPMRLDPVSSSKEAA